MLIFCIPSINGLNIISQTVFSYSVPSIALACCHKLKYMHTPRHTSDLICLEQGPPKLKRRFLKSCVPSWKLFGKVGFLFLFVPGFQRSPTFLRLCLQPSPGTLYLYYCLFLTTSFFQSQKTFQSGRICDHLWLTWGAWDDLKTRGL